MVAYGTQKRKALTGAVTTVKNDALLQISTSFDNILGGAVAGLDATSSSGQPGSALNIRIRGGNSINGGNEPLYVIDGVLIYNTSDATTTGNSYAGSNFNPLASINPSDIESIEVLKDVQSALAPITADEAKEMLKQLKGYKILQGVRGQEGVNLDLYADQVARVSALVQAAPEIAEMDLNPLLGNPRYVTAVDARIRIEK